MGLLFGLFAAVLVCGLLGNEVVASENETANNINYSFAVYRALFNTNENTVFSPFSFRVVLSILYQAASGDTSTELQNQIFKANPADTFFSQKRNLESIVKSPNVKLANKLYLKQGQSLLTTFNNVVNDYHSEIEQVDFAKADAVSKNMNAWVESKTNGLIKNLVNPSSVSSDTSLFLVNTVYFKAKWAQPYDDRQVSTKKFNNIDGTKTPIPFIFDLDDYKYAKLDDFNAEVLEIPYEVNSNFVFWIILPDEYSSLGRLRSLLSNEFVQKTVKNFKSETIDIVFPIIEAESAVDGKEIFSKMGLTSLFNKYELNLFNNSIPLKVDELKQKTKITVNTDGTEAASGTYAKAVPLTIYPSFVANRPFVYMVLTADQHEPIFIGNFVKGK